MCEYYPTNQPAEHGWVCPKCGRVYSPLTPCCWYCGNTAVTYTTGTKITIGDTPETMKDCPTIEAESVKHGQWISVTDKMPEIGKNVLVYAVGRIDGFIGDSIIQICKRYTIKSFPSEPEHEVWSVPFTYFHTDYLITHWMPIPEPPKTDEVVENATD